jgi:prophage antirepressor-like protein
MNEIYDTLDKNYIKFENKTIRIIIDNNEEVWFNANETAEALGYMRPRETIKQMVDLDERKYLSEIKAKIKIGTQPKTIYLSESGLYNLILQSRLPKAKKFKKWITSEVLPSIRKYGNYKLKVKYEKQLDEVLKDLNFLKKENETIKTDMKKEKYPFGGIVYVIDYSENNEEIYRIGMTDDMKKRKSLYDTHTFHKKKVVHIMESECPLRLETCIRAMLYKYRYKNKKDYYICNIQQIKKAFKNCKESIECMEQNGGGLKNNFINTEMIKLTKKYTELNNKLKVLKQKLMKPKIDFL